MAQNALGRTFNWQYLMDNTYVSLEGCEGVAFLCYLTGGVGDIYTLTEAQNASGAGARVLATVTKYWTCTGNGSDAWTERTQSAASTVTTAAATAQNCMVFEVLSAELSAGFTHLKVASTGAGIVSVLQTDLDVQRKPSLLTAIGA